jgi:RES domain-containing protein
MRLWRISNYADLSGEGGRTVEGRWHQRGRLVVYLSEHPALALLETLVHLEIDSEDLPSNYQMLTIEVPHGIAVEHFGEQELDTGNPEWRTSQSITRSLAEPWFAENRSALLRVPSVIVPDAVNFLLNPLHRDAKRMKIISSMRVAFDQRLFAATRKRV